MSWNFIDLTGQRFGKLIVQKRLENSKEKVKWLCLCDCGNNTIVTTSNLKNGNTKSCGCFQRQRSSESKQHDIIGKRFGRLLVKKRTSKDKVLCCCDCGKEKEIKYGNLVSGNTKSCGCLARELQSQNRFDNIAGKTFGSLTVIKRISKIGDKTCKWLCKCTCGMYSIVDAQKLRNGHTSSCGHLRNSKPESIIVHYLKSTGINYEKEFMFKDLLSRKGYPLRFDFKINTNDNFFLLEYQGEQHYRKYDDNFGTQQREYTDKLKKEYCKKHNIELLEIRYDEDIIESLEKILNNHNLLQDNPVPSL